jgi:Xaa-Pro aminopeptidase
MKASSAIPAEKIAQAIALLQHSEFDCWLTFARETMQTPEPALDLIYPHNCTWDSAFIIHRSGRKIAILGRYDADTARNMGVWDEVLIYDQGIAETLVHALRGVGARVIGLNYSLSDSGSDGLTHGNFLRLSRWLPDMTLVSADDLLRRVRETKSAAELARIQAICDIEQGIYARVLALPMRGMTETAIQSAAHAMIAEAGVETDGSPEGNPIVNAGPNSSIGHGLPSPAIVAEPGMVVHFDMWLKKDGYCADLQRCAYVLKPGERDAPELVKRAWDACWLALEAGRALLKPGVQAFETDLAAREALMECGYPEYMHALGHHVGRATHDGGSVLGPRWDRYGDRPFKAIEPGSVFTLELGVLLPDYGYIGLEEMVVVTADGNRYLSTPQRKIGLVH